MLLLFTYVGASATKAYAQQSDKKGIDKPVLHYTSYADSLLTEFINTVYNSIYDSNFRSKSYIPTFTVLKVDIDNTGKVTGVNFSDSADTLFLKAFSQRRRYHDDKSTLEKFAKAKGYTDVSILIPVNYEPYYSANRSIYYNNMNSIMRFNKKDFTGRAIILPPIIIEFSEHER